MGHVRQQEWVPEPALALTPQLRQLRSLAPMLIEQCFADGPGGPGGVEGDRSAHRLDQWQQAARPIVGESAQRRQRRWPQRAGPRTPSPQQLRPVGPTWAALPLPPRVAASGTTGRQARSGPAVRPLWPPSCRT
mmetsp:Transcript_10013/g.31559  ORF Transcript_10013/g.31559 Transcript_10013/m.31559 type:complete len:134 (+) Transcript_10013:684-1085(+)